MFVLIAVLLAAGVFAQQQLGCCCDPVVRTGSIMYQSACASPFVFVPIPVSGFMGCSVLCNATAITPLPPPAVPPAVGCGAPGYTPKVANLAVMPVKGQKAVKIDFNVPCPADSVVIYRCAGAGCTDFSAIVTLDGRVNQYVDSSAGLLWNSAYEYKVIANYQVSGASDPAVVGVNTGDIECWYQTGNDVFCVSPFYYGQFKDYFNANGYKIASSSEFRDNYEAKRDSLFNAFYGKSWFCSNLNVLSRPAPQVSCLSDEICVSDGSAARCVKPEECSIGGVFGFYPVLSACEQDSFGGRKYCFLDRSRSVVDKCYACDPKMRCYDYHSKDACQRDNCGVGQCAWTDVFPDLGIGVCYDSRFDACSLCHAKPSDAAKNKEGFNVVFGACTEAKASALSSTAALCFFDKNTLTGKSCDFVDCTVYSQSQCSSPAGGIQLNPDNSIKVKSNDPCNIGICQYSAATGCVKNADGSAGVGWQDCMGSANPAACEKDYFPPETIASLSGDVPGKQDYFDFIILDRISKADTAKEMQGMPGYKTYLCVVSANNSCNAAVNFPIVTSSARLIINDLDIQDGQAVIGTLRPGNNVVKFFSVDPNNNREVVKSVSVFACEQCSGPKAVNISVTGGRKVGDSFYTNLLQPSITVVLNEPAKVSAFSLDKAGSVVHSAVSPSTGLSYQFTFRPNNPLSEGRYKFSLGAVDSGNVPMDVPVMFNLFIDTTAPSVSFVPADGSEFDSSDVELKLTFSEPVFFNKTALKEVIFIDEYAQDEIPIMLSEKLSSSDNTVFSGLVANLRAGLKIIDVDVIDYASNVLRARSYFSVLAGPPQIRMMHPSWGISSVYVFNVTIETSTKASCRYIAGVPAPPPADSAGLSNFDSSDGILHVINSVSLPYGSTAAYPLHVYCRSQKFNYTQQSFYLEVDSTPPVIVSAYANPNPVVEPVEFGSGVYSTRLQVQMNEEGFCRYSASQQQFDKMEGFFPGFDKVPKKSHSVEINVSEVKSYTYYVACKDKAGLVSQARLILFSVNLDVPFSINSSTEQYSKSGLFYLRVDSNKRAYCYFGEDPGAVTNCFGACEFTNGHVQAVSKPSGSHKFYVKCNTGSGGEMSNMLNLTVTVDTTPPVMVFVDDSSTLPGEPDISWYKNKLRVSFLGKDSETRIVRYWYLIETAFARELVVNWTPSLELNSSPILVKANLTDGQRYVFRVKPENIVGLVGNYSSSDGVTVDFAKAPPQCSNGEKDSDETDVDCGGVCDGCAVGRICIANDDCELFYCSGGVCAEPSCDDGVRNGFETDVDCGGSACPGCDIDMVCAQGSDCLSGSCRFGVCSFDSCSNGLLDGSESDVDCGGSCPGRCGSGQNCNLPGDCAYDLYCIDGVCSVSYDADGDGVPDHLDECPGTPRGVRVDSRGCPIVADAVPVVPVKKPSLFWSLFRWLLLLAVLAGIGYGGYYAYSRGYLEPLIDKFRKKPEAPEAVPMPAVKPMPKGPAPEEKIAALRKFAKKKEVSEEDDFVPLEKLVRTKAVSAPEKRSFEKLKRIREEKPEKKPVRKKSRSDAIERLRKIKK